MARRGLDGRDRNESGQIDKKHGNTLIGTLRRTYGSDFADGYRSDKKLDNLLRDENCDSLSQYLKKR